nr:MULTISPECIES: LysE family transporter [Providencia]
MSPGASFAIALNSTLNNVMKGLIVPIVGTGLGIITHGLLVGVSLTKILASSEWVMMSLIGILGAIYLLYLSFSLITSGIRASENQHQNKIKKVTIKDVFMLTYWI